jgi:hypothetical protein
LHWRQLGYSGTLIGFLWPLGVLAEIALMSISLHAFRVIGATRLLMLGGLACTLRWTIMAFDPPMPIIVFAQFLHGATFAMAHLGAMYFILNPCRTDWPQRHKASMRLARRESHWGLRRSLRDRFTQPMAAAPIF